MTGDNPRRDEVRDRLRQAAEAPAPPPGAAFTDQLEQRLRAVHATLPAAGDGASATPKPGAVHARPWWRSPVPVAAALVLLVAASFGTVARMQDGARLAAAFDATVTLPDGRSVPAEAGQRLGDGAVVLTGPRGHVVSHGVRLGPGEIAVVRGDRLERVEQTRPARPMPSAPPTSRAPGQEVRPLPDMHAVPARPMPAEPRPTSRPTEAPSTRPSPAPGPTGHAPAGEESPGTAPERGSDTAVAHGQAEPDGAHAIGLAVRADSRDGRGRAMVVWTEYRHPDVAFFVVLRSPYPSAPNWPPSDRGEVVGRSNDPQQRQFTDGDVPYRPVYRVVAVDRHGQELARSAAVAPDGSADTAARG